ncbi:MAG: IS1380 family transposase [Tissierellia bacterium]|nr:IS1380 family transposase [Tissierellia bacterium]
MYSLNNLHLECNNKIKLNFHGGDLSSDSGLFLLKEFADKIGFHQTIKKFFKTEDKADRKHKDYDNLSQILYQILAGYFNDNDADELRNEPVLNVIHHKDGLASQPTLSRFFNRMDDSTLEQFDEILKALRANVYSLEPPKRVLLDLDSTLLPAYGKQEGVNYNFHYGSNGYHPLVCYDGLTGDLLKVKLRNGSVYTSSDVVGFLQPILDEYEKNYPDTEIFLRADSGFAKPELYTQAETNGVSYVIRLKANQTLYKLAETATRRMDELTKDNKLDYAVIYDEFNYQAASWDYPRRVVVKVEKPSNQFTYQYGFIVTNMDLSPKNILRLYNNRGRMENFIKEGKNGFNFSSTSSPRKIVNSNRLQVSALAYNLFNWFRRLVLPKSMNKMQIETIRMKLIKIASRITRSARYLIFKLCSSYPYKKEFIKTLENIRSIPKLE